MLLAKAGGPADDGVSIVFRGEMQGSVEAVAVPASMQGPERSFRSGLEDGAVRASVLRACDMPTCMHSTVGIISRAGAGIWLMCL